MLVIVKFDGNRYLAQGQFEPRVRHRARIGLLHEIHSMNEEGQPLADSTLDLYQVSIGRKSTSFGFPGAGHRISLVVETVPALIGRLSSGVFAPSNLVARMNGCHLTCHRSELAATLTRREC